MTLNISRAGYDAGKPRPFPGVPSPFTEYYESLHQLLRDRVVFLWTGDALAARAEIPAVVLKGRRADKAKGEKEKLSLVWLWWDNAGQGFSSST